MATPVVFCTPLTVSVFIMRSPIGDVTKITVLASAPIPPAFTVMLLLIVWFDIGGGCLGHGFRENDFDLGVIDKTSTSRSQSRLGRSNRHDCDNECKNEQSERGVLRKG